MDMIMEAQISHLIGDDQTPAQLTTVWRSEIQLQSFPDNDEERNKYGRVKNSQWKKKCESNKLGGGENNFGHACTYALTAID